MSADLPARLDAPLRVVYRDNPVAPRARRVGASGRQKFLATALLLAAGVVGLVVANGAARDVSHGSTALVILAASFLLAVATIGFTSLADEMQVSLQAMMLYFAIYLALPGFNHASRNAYPFYGAVYDRRTQEDAALMLLLFLICALVAYILARTLHRSRPSAVTRSTTVDPNIWFSVGLTSVAVIGTAVYVSAVGIGGVFATRNSLDVSSLQTDVSGLGLIIALPRTLCTASIVYALVMLRYSTYKSAALLVVGVNLLLCTITLWPPALSRTTLFGVLLFIATIFIDFARPARRLMLSVLYLFGALVAMPLANALTRGGQTLSQIRPSVMFSAFFRSGDFDGLQSLNNVVLFVAREGPQYGNQLLSALFFFVPRALWSSKALPTGAAAADAAGYKFVNISMPLPGEFFSDLSWLGVIAGGAATGWILCRLDRFIDANWMDGARGRIVAGAVIGYSTIIFRGTLIGVIGPVAVLCALIYLMLRFGVRSADPPRRASARRG